MEKPRRRKILRDNIQGLTKPAFERIARKAGVKSMSGLCQEELRGLTKVTLEILVMDVITFTKNRKAKTVSINDVLAAIQNHNKNFAFSTDMKKHIKRC